MNILEKGAAMNGGAQAGPGPDMEDDDPENNPAYVQAKELMLSKLYEEGAAKGLAGAIAAAPDRAQGVVDQIMALLEAVETATQGAVPDELVLPFTLETVTEVCEIAEDAGMALSDSDIAVVTREVLARLVEVMGGDATAIRQEMNSIDPEQIAAEANAVPEEA